MADGGARCSVLAFVRAERSVVVLSGTLKDPAPSCGEATSMMFAKGDVI